MKESDYAFLIANIFLAQVVGKPWAAVVGAVYMIFFAIFRYLGQ